MFLTHSFAHQETLDRARYWLTQFGFDPSRIEVQTEGTPRISLWADHFRVTEAELLFAALELTEPDGPLGFWDSTHPQQLRPLASVGDLAEHHPERRASTPLSWHSPDVDLLNDPRVRAIREALGF
jgi:hypothetical protein